MTAPSTLDPPPSEIGRQRMDIDIACVGFGPAMGGFLHTLSKGLMGEDGIPVVESKAIPGLPLQVVCYERADDLGFNVSGVVTRGRSIRESFPDFKSEDFPTAADVKEEKIIYLIDPHGASRKGVAFKLADLALKPFCKKTLSFELPWIPGFLEKKPGFVFSMGQFSQWVGSQIMGSGMAQIWPATPVSRALLENSRVTGVRLIDQGTDLKGNPAPGFMPGMDIGARLTVVGDGPVGAIGQQLDQHFGMPEGHHRHDWAVGMKMLVDLPRGCDLKPGTVIHTMGYPEPEIFGFFYVLPDNVASLGIFIPSWFDNPVRTAYRYMQHWMNHPYLWRWLEGGTLRSWGAKSLDESGRRGEPHLVGDGYARIGEGSGSTNVLTNSGVDEAWKTGALLGQSVLELLKEDRDFSRDNLESTYVKGRRESWLEEESGIAEKARDGFSKGMVRGMLGMGLAGLTGGKLYWPGKTQTPYDRVPSLEDFYRGRLRRAEIDKIREDCRSRGLALHGALMDRAGWPSIPYDGQLLMSHQDALLLGGKVQAQPGYADHVTFKDPEICGVCREQICIECCSGEAIAMNADGMVPLFDREKCIHCGACLWNCSKADPENGELSNVAFVAGSGGLHSAEN